MSTITTPQATASIPARGGVLAGTWPLIRFILRRDRIRLPVWIVAIALSVVASAASYVDTYPTAADRQSLASVMELPATVAMVGPAPDVDDYTYGAALAQAGLGITAVAAALMSVLLVIRHTRAEEATGRAELVRATVVGRYANLTATLVVVGTANLVLGAVVALGLGASGVESITWSGSLLFGAALAAVGLVFVGVAAVTAQLTEHAGGASGMAGAVIGVAYALRAVGDVGDRALSWLSPFGWAQATGSFVDHRWWPLLLAVGLTAVLVAAGTALSSRRDVGAGLVPPRPGSPKASDALASPLGLAVRLQRTSLIAWGVGIFLFGILYGSILGDVDVLLSEIEAMEDLLIEGASATDSFAATVMLIMAMLSSIQVVLAVSRLRSEETAGRAEPLLATALSRPRWAASHLTIAMVGGAGVLLLAGLGLGISAAVVLDDASMVPTLLGAALAYVPALWLTVGVGLALFGLVPRVTALTWTVVVYAFIVLYLGPYLQFPAWMDNLSPFGHVPQLPADDLTIAPLVALTAIATALLVIGLMGFQRRGINVA